MKENLKLERRIKHDIATIAEEHTHLPTGSLRSRESIIEKNKQELESFFLKNDDIESSMSNAASLLKSLGFELFDDDSLDLMQECMEKIKSRSYTIENMLSMREMFGIKIERLHDIYELGLILHEGGFLTQARDIFLFLINLDSSYLNCWHSLAITLRAMKQPENAMRIYGLLIQMEENPDYFIQAIDCSIESSNHFEASKLLAQLESLECSDDHKHKVSLLKKKVKR